MFISSAREEQKTEHLERQALPRCCTILFHIVRARRLDWGGDDFARKGIEEECERKREKERGGGGIGAIDSW